MSLQDIELALKDLLADEVGKLQQVVPIFSTNGSCFTEVAKSRLRGTDYAESDWASIPCGNGWLRKSKISRMSMAPLGRGGVLRRNND